MATVQFLAHVSVPQVGWVLSVKSACNVQIQAAAVTARVMQANAHAQLASVMSLVQRHQRNVENALRVVSATENPVFAFVEVPRATRKRQPEDQKKVVVVETRVVQVAQEAV